MAHRLSKSKRYDRKHSPETFEEGAEVLTENTAQKQRKGGKLHVADKFLGPYTINRHMGKGLYELRNKSGKVLQKKVNMNRLKRFNSNKVIILLPLHHAVPFIINYYTCAVPCTSFIICISSTLHEQDGGKEDDDENDGKKTGSDWKEDDDKNDGNKTSLEGKDNDGEKTGSLSTVCNNNSDS